MPRLSARQKAYIRRKTRQPPVDPSTEEGELNIVPFLDVVVNLIMFLLLTVTVALTGHEVSAQLPTYGPGTPGWGVTVTLSAQGEAFVSDGAGTFAPGCTAHAAGATVPRVGDGPDWLALRSCAEALHVAHPDANAVTIAADPMVPLADVVRAMDAMRGSHGRPLFPNVRLAAGVR